MMDKEDERKKIERKRYDVGRRLIDTAIRNEK